MNRSLPGRYPTEGHSLTTLFGRASANAYVQLAMKLDFKH